MPSISDDLIQIDPTSPTDVTTVYDVKGVQAEQAVALLTGDGFSVATQDASGPVDVSEGGWTVVGQELISLESHPVQLHVVLTVERA